MTQNAPNSWWEPREDATKELWVSCYCGVRFQTMRVSNDVVLRRNQGQVHAWCPGCRDAGDWWFPAQSGLQDGSAPK